MDKRVRKIGRRGRRKRKGENRVKKRMREIRGMTRRLCWYRRWKSERRDDEGEGNEW